MGMLIRRHRDRQEQGDVTTSQDTAPEGGVYDDLSDEQVAEAYATNVGGRATKRESQVAALEELDNE